jgi:hypothetical protein
VVIGYELQWLWGMGYSGCSGWVIVVVRAGIGTGWRGRGLVDSIQGWKCRVGWIVPAAYPTLGSADLPYTSSADLPYTRSANLPYTSVRWSYRRLQWLRGMGYSGCKWMSYSGCRGELQWL